MTPTVRVASAHPRYGQDRALAVAIGDAVVLVVADGAGGTARGALAADRVVTALATCRDLPADWCAWLRERDRELAALGGQAAAVVVEVHANGRVCGASVGDCEAHVLSGDDEVELTEYQRSKPLLGDGRAEPVAFFDIVPRGATIVLASDGLWKYAPPERVARALSETDRAAALIDCARLPSGALPDDVGVVVLDVAA